MSTYNEILTVIFHTGMISYYIDRDILDLLNLDPSIIALHRHLYVDDCIDLQKFQHTKDIGKAIQKLIATKQDWGIQDNADKGQLMTNEPVTKLNKFHKGHGTKIPVNDKHIQVVNAAKYLGTYVQIDARADKAVQYRLSLVTCHHSVR